MIADLICFVISLCCGGPRQGHERRHIHDIIDDIEQLADTGPRLQLHRYAETKDFRDFRCTCWHV